MHFALCKEQQHSQKQEFFVTFVAVKALTDLAALDVDKTIAVIHDLKELKQGQAKGH
jgi:hypothetical protein